MRNAAPTPLDVKLMNTTASLLFMVFALLVAGAVAGWAVRHPVFAIRGITVSGEVTHNNAVTLRANVTPRLSGTFFTLDLTATRLAFEAVPWVRQAVVRREFPNRLKVQLQEHKAVAYWGPESDSRLLNNFGEVLKPMMARWAQALPVGMALTGRPGAGDTGAASPVRRDGYCPEQLEMTSHGGWRRGSTTAAALGSAAAVLRRFRPAHNDFYKH
jgi:cell division protein FtsQ